MNIKRKNTKVINIGGVRIGGGHPIAIQSMTKVKTAGIKKTVSQIRALERAGCEIIRVAVKDIDDACALSKIKKQINIPLVADIHFDYRLALGAIKHGADKIRVNPGNIGKPSYLEKVIKAARAGKVPIRIGVNSGSVGVTDKNNSSYTNRLIDLAGKYIRFFERRGFRDLVVSLKSSNVLETMRAYKKCSGICDYPLHLGVTAAGSYEAGIVKSSIGIGSLLAEGIGDTIRVSLTGNPVSEVMAAKRILQSLNLRYFWPDVVSCPTCGRCQVDLSGIVKEFTNRYLSSNAIRNKHDAIRTGPLNVAIMGCEVNGPGEAKEADIGIAFGKNSGIIFEKGKVVKKVKFKDAVKELIGILKKANK